MFTALWIMETLLLEISQGFAAVNTISNLAWGNFEKPIVVMMDTSKAFPYHVWSHLYHTFCYLADVLYIGQLILFLTSNGPATLQTYIGPHSFAMSISPMNARTPNTMAESHWSVGYLLHKFIITQFYAAPDSKSKPWKEERNVFFFQFRGNRP